MRIKEKILFEEILGKSYRVRLFENDNHSTAAFTHYLHNSKSKNSKYFKEEAIEYIKSVLENTYNDEKIENKKAEEALQQYLFDFESDSIFPPQIKPKFTFIDLFAGIGGVRLALQNIGGKCVFTSEWDEQAKKTYFTNFGEVPFGDITLESTKQFIPDNFDVLCAGFPCQAFSIAGKRGGFEDTRGTLFFDVAEIIKRKKPKAIFLENVKGLRNHNGGRTLETILNVLRNDLDYFVPEPQIINAKNYGIPQNRERIFIVGFRNDIDVTEFNYPKSTNKAITFENIKEENNFSLCIPLIGQAFSSNLFASSTKKRFLLQTQKAA